MQKLTSTTAAAAALVLVAANCAADTGPDGSAARSGGPADDLSEAPACASETQAIAAARARLVEEEPDFYELDRFSDDMAGVESLGDLDADGHDDLVVFPGFGYAGANTEQVVYLTDATGCATRYVGHFGAASVAPTDDGATTNGVRDLAVLNTSGCSGTISTYRFDGERYVEAGYVTEELCEPEPEPEGEQGDERA